MGGRNRLLLNTVFLTMQHTTYKAPLPPLRSQRLLEQVRERVRYLHFSLRTEQAYVHWTRAFVRFHSMWHPAEMGGDDVAAFLSWLAGERHVAVATHRQALSALLFLYQRVLGQDLPWMHDIDRPQRPPRLLYGTGMRISEALQLRVKDVDFAGLAIVVRDGKGGKDRGVMLPVSLVPALREQLVRSRMLYTHVLKVGCDAVRSPLDALAA